MRRARASPQYAHLRFPSNEGRRRTDEDKAGEVRAGRVAKAEESRHRSSGIAYSPTASTSDRASLLKGEFKRAALNASARSSPAGESHTPKIPVPPSRARRRREGHAAEAAASARRRMARGASVGASSKRLWLMKALIL